MHPMDVEAIVRASRGTEIAFAYEKDCYALSLLTYVIGGGRPISALRKGRFARLLEKALVKRALARAVNGLLTPDCLRAALPERLRTFRISFSHWGSERDDDDTSSYYQTSRSGQNLVVQLNFPSSHDEAYERLIEPEPGRHPFGSDSHPVRLEAPFTLAWVRLDIDFDSDEMLIEEVQCDWVKLAEVYRKLALAWLDAGEPSGLRFDDDLGATAPRLLAYVEGVLRPYARVWEECALMAALELAYSEFGRRRVFFHTYDGGVTMKRLRSTPPRSLYTDLPERFCFVRTDTGPRLFRNDPRVRGGEVSWFELSLV